MSKPPAIGRQLDWCQVCGRKIHRRDLVRTQVKWKSPAGQNYLKYSSYDTAYWVSGATKAGDFAVGSTGNYARIRVPDDNTLVEIGGSATFTGTGSAQITKNIQAEAIDMSSWTSLVFSAHVGPWGPYDATTLPSQELTVILRLQSWDGTSKDSLVTRTILNGARIWGTINVADMTVTSSSVHVGISVTAASTAQYWIDDIMLEKDVTEPSQAIIKTKGTIITGVLDTTNLSVKRVCPSCKERLHKVSDLRGKPRREIEAPVSVDIQEL